MIPEVIKPHLLLLEKIIESFPMISQLLVYVEENTRIKKAFVVDCELKTLVLSRGILMDHSCYDILSNCT